MTKTLKIDQVKVLGCVLSVCFLLIHVAMLLFFLRYGVTPMVCFNIFSILFYITSLWMLKAGHLWTYTISVYLEVVLHMTAAVVFVGVDSGFQVTLLGMNTLVFYAEYLSNHLKLRHVSGTVLSCVGMVMYLASFVCSRLFPPVYSLPQKTCFWLQITWGIISFAVNIFFLKIFVIITSNSERMLSDQAIRDGLTGLYNRAGYEEILSGADLSHTTLLLVDVDRFKSINDTYGHEVGDRAMKKVAVTLRSNFRSDDFICRIGGDEFAVIMSNQTSLLESLIRTKITVINSLLADGCDGLPGISVSVGAAFGGDAPDSLFERADKALYQRKQEGRCGCTFFKETPNGAPACPDSAF